MNRLAYLLDKIVELKLSPTMECVEWPYSLDHGGYGQVWFQNRIKRVHRVAYQLYHGRRAEELVLHKCDNPKCFNPAHLYIGDHSQNMKDSLARGQRKPRSIPRITHKKNGRNSRYKLTDEDVTRILHRLARGETCRAIADDFPVTFQAIGLIKAGKTWKHIPRPWTQAATRRQEASK